MSRGPEALHGEGTGDARLMADVMLERLARWLRVLGVDVVSAAGGVADEVVAAQVMAEGRVLLTRDRRLAESLGGRAVLVRGAAPSGQLAEVIAALGIAWPGEGALFRRCLVCNTPLRVATAEEAARAAPAALARGEVISACPVCGRVYWDGGHTRRMRRVVERVVERVFSGREGAGP